MWLREYIFNALLQPIHCIIYVVIFGSVMELVEEYPLYGLIALGFMVPAEKFIRKMFGFEKASTVGGFNAMAGTAALMGGLQRLGHARAKGREIKEESKEKDYNENRGIRTIDSIPTLALENNNEQQSNRMSIFENSINNEESSTLNPISDEQGEATSTMLNNSSGETDSSTSLISKDEEQQRHEPINMDKPVENNGNANRRKPKINIKNGIKTLSGHYARRLNNGVRKIHPVRALRRGITYGIGAATLGTIGLAAGIASGDPSKALQYTTAGGMVGGNIGRNIGEKASNAMGIKYAAKAFEVGALGERYAEKERNRQKAKFKSDVSNYNIAIKRVNQKGWNEMSPKDGIIDQAMDYGINDIDAMCNIYKTQQEFIKNGMSEKEAAESAFRAYKLNEEFGDYNKNSKTQENLEKILESKGYSSGVKEKTKKEILNLINTYKNISND